MVLWNPPLRPPLDVTADLPLYSEVILILGILSTYMCAEACRHSADMTSTDQITDARFIASMHERPTRSCG